MRTAPKLQNNIGTRLRQEMTSRGISSAELAKRAGVKTSFLYDVLSGKSAHPSTVTLARVAEVLGVDLADLAGGETTRRFAIPKLKQDDFIAVPYVMLDNADEGKIVAVRRDDSPCVFNKNWISGQLGAKPDDVQMFALRGDQMQPTLQHNDLLLIDVSRTRPSPPGLFLLFDGNGLVVKRLEYATPAGTRLRVMSDNPQYSTYERDAHDALIVGAVIWFGRGI